MLSVPLLDKTDIDPVIGMDVKIYNEIISSKGIDPEFPESHFKIPMGELWFHQDILRGKAMWSDNTLYDWRLFLCNNHSLLSLCFATPSHPYTKKWRLFTLLSTIISSSIFISITSYIMSLDLSTADFWASKFGISTANTIVVTIVDRSLMYLSICPCAYDKRKCCFKCCTRLSGIFTACCSCVSISCFIGSMVMNSFLDLWEVWIVQFIIAWISSFALTLITLSLKFLIERHKDGKMYKSLLNDDKSCSQYEKAKAFYNINVLEYLQYRNKNMEWKIEPSKLHEKELKSEQIAKIMKDDDDNDEEEDVKSNKIDVVKQKATNATNHLINSLRSESYKSSQAPSFLISHNGTAITLDEMRQIEKNDR